MNGFALTGRSARIVAALHDGGVQVEVVGHDRRAKDADGDVKHGWVGHDRRGWNDEAAENHEVFRTREEDLHTEHNENRPDEGDDEGFDPSKSPTLEEEDEQDVETRDEHAVEKWDMEEELESNGRANDFSEITGRDGDLGAEPEGEADALAVGLVTELGQITLGSYAELEGEVLEQDRHQVGEHDDEEERVAKAGTARDVGGPVA